MNAYRKLERKYCPWRPYRLREPSLTVEGEWFERTEFLECCGKLCAAYDETDGKCYRNGGLAIDTKLPEEVEE